MNEPKRLLDEAGSSFERSLLSALASERPSPELARRMHQGIALTSVAAGTKLAAAGHGVFGWAGLVAAGLFAGVAASEGPELHPSAPTPRVASALAARPPTATVEAARPAVPAPPPPALAVEQAAAPARVRSAAPRGGELHDEIRLLDSARNAVRGRRANEALKLLGRYRQQYPAGQFRQEALVLRVEALELAGKPQAAQALGKRFLSDHPESPHAERVERVTAPR